MQSITLFHVLSYMYGCFVCMHVCAPYVCLLPEYTIEGIKSPRMRVTDSYELPCKCWQLNLGPLEEQPVLLTTEPSFSPFSLCFKTDYIRHKSPQYLGLEINSNAITCF